MRILKKFKKVLLLMIFSVIFSATALSQTGSALTLTPSNNFYATAGSSSYPTNTLIIQRTLLPLLELNVTFLQFDISGLKNHIVTSSTLGLYGSGLLTASLYKVFDSENSWMSSPSGTFNQTQLSALIGSSPTPIVASVAIPLLNDWSYFSSTSFVNALQDSIDTSGNNYFSVALRSDIVGLASFTSGSGTFGPKLEVDAYPVPEPSSMILSLIGICGILGFSKNRGKLL